ncbi:MAG: carboxypeptidase-like regulatory domain-containing protein, partial [Fidelibacterota bacterium]
MLSTRYFLFATKGIFIFLLPVTLLTGQPYLLVGTVKSETTRSPVPYANIAVEGTEIGAATSPGGGFELKVPRLPVTLKISHIGYASRLVEASSTDVGTVFLKPTVLTGEEVWV